MYKVGDKVLCKRDYSYKNEISYTIGVYYNIIKRDNQMVGLSSDSDVRGYWNFSINIDLQFNDESFCHFHEYFYTLEEIRILKLKKLDESYIQK